MEASGGAGRGGDRGGPDTLLWVLLGERHWRTWETFETQFFRAARELARHEEEPRVAQVTLSQRTFQRWLSGGVKSMPYPVACRVLEHMFGHPVEKLLSPAAAATAAPEDSAISEGIVTAYPVRAENQNAVPYDPPEEDVDRRQLLKVFGGVAAAPLIAGIDRPRRELENSIDPVTTSADADEWDRVVLQYTSEVGRVPPVQIIPDLHADFDEAQLRLANSSDALRTRMLRVCGQLSALMAISFINIGEFRVANRYWRSATRAADETGDRALQSLVRGRRAVFALYDDKTPPSSILSLAGEAIEAGGGQACAGVASGYAARAQTLALLGRHEESGAAVRDLADLFEHLPGITVDDRTSQWGWSEQRLRHVESHVYSYAGQLDKANAAQEAALALYPKDGYQGRTQVELYRSICIIRAGDPTEGARHVIRTVQALPPSRHNDAVVRRTAALALRAVPPNAANLAAVLEARGLLAITEGS